MMKTKSILIAISLFSIPTFSIAQEVKPAPNTPELIDLGEKETEVEWKIMANPEDITVDQTVAKFIKNAATAENNSAKEKALIKRFKNLLNQEPQKLKIKDLSGLKRVRSIQISDLGVFSYPYFKCRFKNTEKGPFFEKTTGSQRKSGFVFANTVDTIVFLGAWTVNDEAQRQYSGLNKAKDKQYDQAGVFVKRGKTVLAIFPRKDNRFEIYEFK
jgi:hypothetical protein